MSINLTANAIPAIIGGEVNLKPLVQVLDVKRIGATQDRYRLVISDSVSTQQAMLATQLNDRLKIGEIRVGSVVQLIEYICSTVQNRKIIVVLNMETIVLECETIGNPVAYVDNGNLGGQRTGFENGSGYQARPGNDFSAPVNPGNRMQPPQMYQARPGRDFSATVTSGNRMQQNVRPNAPQMYQPRPTVQPSYQPPPPNYRNHGAIVKNEAPASVIPIAALNPYQGRWAIKARVTSKSDLRRYNNARGDGKVFSFDLLDSEGGEIRVTCFNAVCDRFFEVIEVGRVYMISKGSLKPAQKNYNHLNNEWEIFLESTSTVDLCPDEDSSIPQQQFAFRPISDIENTENNSILDIIGVVTSVNPSVAIMRKNGTETQRRILTLKDQSSRSVELTLWGDFCNKEGRELEDMVGSGFFPVLAVKAGRVNDFSGKTLGTISSSQLFIEPEFPEARDLRNWFESGGKDTSSLSISKDNMPAGQRNETRKTVCQIKEEGLGRADKPDWIMVKASISFVKADNFCYTACPLMIGGGGDRKCSKKVVRSGDARWQCERCNQEFEECDYRYLLTAQVQDHTGYTWVTGFQEAGEAIFGCSAKELYSLKHEGQDEGRFEEIIHNSLFKQYLFKLKIKEEMYGDEQKVKITIAEVNKVDPSSEARFLLDLISKASQYKLKY
ncbi:Replication protein A 70 kDa DNA-binding subunit A [Ranunculus cassubicifolius]